MWLRNRVILFTGFFLLITFLTVTGSFAQCMQVNVGVIIDKKADPCNGPITLDAHFPGYSHSWNTGANTQKIVVTKSGIYIVTVDDGKGCIGHDTVDVTFLDKPFISLGADSIAQCGGCVHLDPGAGAGFTYQWSTGESTEAINFCTVGSTNVSVKVTNDVGCAVSDTINVTITPGLIVDFGPDIVTCDSVVNLNSGNPGATHTWNTGDTTSTISVKNSGTYYVDVQDHLGCKGVDTIHITFNPRPVVNLGPDPAPVCGSCIKLNAGSFPGSTIHWNMGQSSSSINYCDIGTHDVSVKVTNSFGCSDADTVQVSIAPGLEVDLGEDFISCDPEVMISAGIEGMKYKWNTGDTTVTLNVTHDGTYYVDVVDSKGCTGSDTITITFKSKPVVNLGSDPAARCGGCVNLDAGNQTNLSYYWSTGDTSSSIKYCEEGANKVWVTVFNTDGCSESDTVTVDIKAGYHFSLGPDTSVCSGSITLKGPSYSGATYHWNTGETTTSIKINSSGTYYLDISHMSGCTASDIISDSINVVFNSGLPAPDAILDLSDCNTKKFVATNVQGATSYIWTVPKGSSIASGQGTSTIYITYSGTVTGNISVVADNGNPSCQSLPTILPVNLGDNPLNIPNAFSPNNDGINDTWVIRNIQYFPENDLMVLNRWGNEVYRQEHYKNEWDGNGLNEGSYFYKLKVKFCNEEKVMTGYITIVR